MADMGVMYTCAIHIARMVFFCPSDVTAADTFLITCADFLADEKLQATHDHGSECDPDFRHAVFRFIDQGIDGLCHDDDKGNGPEIEGSFVITGHFRMQFRKIAPDDHGRDEWADQQREHLSQNDEKRGEEAEYVDPADGSTERAGGCNGCADVAQKRVAGQTGGTAAEFVGG